MKIHFIVFSFFLLFLNACSSDPKDSVIQISGKTMGTRYNISLIKPQNTSIDLSKDRLQQSINALLIEINHQMSTYEKDSEISRFNNYHSTQWISISNDFLSVIKAALLISKKSDGAFDITVGPLVDLWGFGPRIINKIPSDTLIKTTLQHTGYKKLRINESPPSLKKIDPLLRIDLSAIAKGFAVDKISHYLTQQGITNHLVEIGGEVKASGFNQFGQPWRVAIENPDSTQASTQNRHIINLTNSAIATSGDYRNYFIKDGKRYSHTIDPKTGEPIKHKLASVTVVHPSTMLADAYATALMVLGEKKGITMIYQEKLTANLIIRHKNTFSNWNNLSPSP